MKTNTLKSSGFRLRYGPAGVHVFNRNTGMNILIDEIVPPISTWTQSPRHISIALTNSCDLSCPHCYAPKTPAKLSYDQITKWLKELDVAGTLSVGFGGGEPTIYARLPDLCRFATQNTNMAVTMTTHGHHLTEDYLQELQGNVHFIRVSMDGVGQTYDAIRGRPYSALLTTIDRLGKTFMFGINYLVNEKTITQLDQAIAEAAAAGASEFLLLPERYTPRHGGGISPRTSAELGEWINNYSGKLRLAIADYACDGLPICNALESENGLSNYAHIDASGRLKLTSYDSSGINIEPHGIMAALQNLRADAGRLA